MEIEWPCFFSHFFCLCPLGLTIKLNFNISKWAYWGCSCLIQDVNFFLMKESIKFTWKVSFIKLLLYCLAGLDELGNLRIVTAESCIHCRQVNCKFISGLCLDHRNQTEQCKSVIAIAFPNLLAAVVEYYHYINYDPADRRKLGIIRIAVVKVIDSSIYM